MNLGRGAMYSRTQQYTLQTHRLPDEEPSPNTGRDNRPQGNASSTVNGGAIYTRTQHYTLQTHGLPDKEPMPGSSGDNRRQMNAPSKMSGGAIYTRTQRYTLQTHSLPDKEPMPSSSGEHQQQATEAEEDESVDAERRKNRMPEKRTSETQSNQSAGGSNHSNRGKKLKKAPNSSSAAQHTVRSNEASPEELYLTALGTEDVNPWAGQQEPQPSAPVAADSTGWSRPYTESAGTAAPAQQARSALQHAASVYGSKSSGLNMALVDCLDSLSGLDPNATYKIEYVPPVPARLTLTRLESPSLPPPPLLFPYGVPEGSQRTCRDSRQMHAAAPVRTEALAEETRPDSQWPRNVPGCLSPNRRPPNRTEPCGHLPERCIPLPWLREHLAPVVKYVKDDHTTICSTKGCQTDFAESNNSNSTGKCCPLISANRVLLHHHAPKNRGNTTVLEVDHVSGNQGGPTNSSTPNEAGKSRSLTPSIGVRPLGHSRPPEVRSPKGQPDKLDFQQPLNRPCGDNARERNVSESDSSSSAYSVTYSVPNSPETSYSSYPGQREKE